MRLYRFILCLGSRGSLAPSLTGSAGHHQGWFGSFSSSRCLASLVLSERYTLQQLCELAADKDASFASRVLAASAHPTPRLRIRALSSILIVACPGYANKRTRQHTVQNQRVNVHNGSTMLRSDSRSAQLAGVSTAARKSVEYRPD
jgi:hypothetical protein